MPPTPAAPDAATAAEPTLTIENDANTTTTTAAAATDAMNNNHDNNDKHKKKKRSKRNKKSVTINNSNISNNHDDADAPPTPASGSPTSCSSDGDSAGDIIEKKESNTPNNKEQQQKQPKQSQQPRRQKHQKQQTEKKSTTESTTPKSMTTKLASTLSSIMYACLLLISICRTVPLLITTATISSCGKEHVHGIVNSVLTQKQNLDGASQPTSTEATATTTFPSAATEDDSGNMCHMASLAIGHFVYWVPYGLHLLGFTEHDQDANAAEEIMAGGTTLGSEEEEEVKQSKKGILQRAVSRHKSKHHKTTASSSTSSASDEIDRQHPLRHILEGASIFSHHKKMKKEKKHQKQQQQQQQHGKKSMDSIEVDWKKWKYAMTDDFELSSEQDTLVKELAKRVVVLAKQMGSKKSVEIVESLRTAAAAAVGGGGGNDSTAVADNNDGSDFAVVTKPFIERVDQVPWGGMLNNDSNRWYPRKDGKNSNRVSAQAEGGRLLASYLKIMKWQKNLHVKYPFKLCANGCDSEVAILHTLEWREKYQPWCISPSAIQRNNAGFVYHRGHSRAGPQQRLEAERTNNLPYLSNAGHSMVLYRPGLTDCQEPELYIRTILYSLEHAVSDALLRNNGEIGRFNVVMDCEGMGRKSAPGLAYIKKGFTFLQDHYPDRLGVLLVANLSGIAQMMMKMVLPFVTEDVRSKIHIIPSDEKERRELLLQFIDEDQIPDWLGGKDEYRFESKDYYNGENKCVLSEEKIMEYRETMPYHA